MTPILEVRNITKRFPGVLANDKVSFSLNQREILAFLGENGAGKSTLMNMIYGLYTPDEGEIELRGEPVTIVEPNDAIELGIGMVHQHFQLVPVFTVAENIVMGTEPTRFAFSWRALGLAGGISALLFFLGSLFGLDSPSQWILAGVVGGLAVAALYATFFALGYLSRLGFWRSFVIAASAAVVPHPWWLYPHSAAHLCGATFRRLVLSHLARDHHGSRPAGRQAAHHRPLGAIRPGRGSRRRH